MTDQNPLELKFDKTQLTTLVDAINNLVRSYAYSQIKDEKGTDRKARFLKVFGMTEREIADMLGVSQPAVNMALSKAKKKGKQPQEAE